MIQESGEMYLETILILSGIKPEVHAIDIASEMRISKPSVSRALSKLKFDGYIIVDNDGRIAFSEKGRRLAEKILERHKLLKAVLLDLGIDEETAEEDACKIEHAISDTTFNAIRKRFEQ